jgi:hypothetical protein
MPNVRRQVAAETPGAEEPSLSAPTKGTPDEALELIFAPLKNGDGFRHYDLGAPGFGKTVAMRWVIASALERQLVDIVLTHDIKLAEPEFPDGVLLVDAQAAHGQDAQHLVFRGDVRSDIECPAEEVALLGKRLAQQENLTVLLNIGEFDNCLSDGGRGWTAPTVRWFSAQGRALRACLTGTAQQPKRVPDEVWDHASTIALHHLDERSANYLGNTMMLDPDLVAVLPKLAQFEFVVRQQGREWNHRVYRVAPPGL